MQGLWNVQRRTKVNLNTISSPAVEEPTAAPPVDSPQQNDVKTPQVGDPLSSGKRKARSAREDGGSTKRTKFSRSGEKDYTPPTTRLRDLGGVEACVEKMLELVAMPLCHPEIYLHTGVQPPRGVLLHGPPGCGKTMLANAIAGVCSSFCSLNSLTVC